ncbi:hypothetical protein VTN31DRAFT_4972 [Thermomyces dupontii]|uniref:uncharacterized protein n=1 Tax=Talaromyces thermophilus TaxID=28565 RepID=UPI003743D6CF
MSSSESRRRKHAAEDDAGWTQSHILLFIQARASLSASNKANMTFLHVSACQLSRGESTRVCGLDTCTTPTSLTTWKKVLGISKRTRIRSVVQSGTNDHSRRFFNPDLGPQKSPLCLLITIQYGPTRNPHPLRTQSGREDARIFQGKSPCRSLASVGQQTRIHFPVECGRKGMTAQR